MSSGISNLLTTVKNFINENNQPLRESKITRLIDQTVENLFSKDARLARLALYLTGNPNNETNNCSSTSLSEISVKVPVKAGEGEWNVIQNSLPMLADKAGVSQEAKQVFVQKWKTELEKTGQTGVINNKNGKAIEDNAFKAGIDKAGASAKDGVVGTYKITITNARQSEMLNDLRLLRQNDLAVSSIKDPVCRREALSGLNQIVLGTGAEKTAAAQKLLNMTESGQADAETVYLATKALSNRDETSFNASLKMVVIQMDAEKYGRMIGPVDQNAINESLRLRTSEAIQLAGKSDYAGNLTVADGAPDRAEAAWVNKQAAQIYAKVGDKVQSKHREMIGRFYEVDAAELEKVQYPLQTSIERWKPTNGTAMRAVTPEEQELKLYYAENGKPNYPTKELGEDPQKREWKKTNLTDEKGDLVLDKNGNPVEVAQKNYVREGSLKGQDAEIDYEVRLNERGEEVKSKSLPMQREIKTGVSTKLEGPELNGRGTGRALGVGGAVGALEEVNKWVPFLSDLKYGTTASKIAARDRLEKGAKEATHFPIPPRPEELGKYKTELERQCGKAKAEEMMKSLEEMSHAFWNQKTSN